MLNYFNLLKIQHLEGGSYNIDSIIKAIQTFSNWALRVGIALSGVALIIGFILYAVVDVDQMNTDASGTSQWGFGYHRKKMNRSIPPWRSQAYQSKNTAIGSA